MSIECSKCGQIINNDDLDFEELGIDKEYLEVYGSYLDPEILICKNCKESLSEFAKFSPIINRNRDPIYPKDEFYQLEDNDFDSNPELNTEKSIENIESFNEENAYENYINYYIDSNNVNNCFEEPNDFEQEHINCYKEDRLDEYNLEIGLDYYLFLYEYDGYDEEQDVNEGDLFSDVDELINVGKNLKNDSDIDFEYFLDYVNQEKEFLNLLDYFNQEKEFLDRFNQEKELFNQNRNRDPIYLRDEFFQLEDNDFDSDPELNTEKSIENIESFNDENAYENFVNYYIDSNNVNSFFEEPDDFEQEHINCYKEDRLDEYNLEIGLDYYLYEYDGYEGYDGYDEEQDVNEGDLFSDVDELINVGKNLKNDSDIDFEYFLDYVNQEKEFFNQQPPTETELDSETIINTILKDLNSRKRFRDKIEHLEIIPPRIAKHGKLKNLPTNIESYLKRNNINLYFHQYEAAKELRNGNNILITTPTASGKTLSFNIPILEKLSLNEKATALYIYPAKALANDQKDILIDLENELEMDVKPDIYDGDTPRDKRPGIKKNSRIIITNPYELHLVLGWHRQWARFYSNLQFVVIDEAHHYRGVFGSNVAFLIRRLRRICNYYGSNPQFILSSATLANPHEFGNKLVGLNFKLIDEDSSPKGKKYFLLYNPFKVNDELSTHQETKNLFLYSVISHLQTLCFTSSRKMTEIIANWSRNELNLIEPKLVDKITAYRAGYLPQDRRKIEKRLKEGELIGVTTTNALELGINIGSLDAVIISGYPGTIISTWQQAGRAGRGTKESLVILVAYNNPLDQYLMHHSNFLFDKAHENAIIDLENIHLTKSHLLCASFELPLSYKDMKNYFPEGQKITDELTQKNLIFEENEIIYYNKQENPALEYGLSSISSEIFKIYFGKKLLETMDRSHAYREAHEGAVLMNQGETYVVDRLDLNNQSIMVKKKDVDYNTQVMVDSDINIIKEHRIRNLGKLCLHFGDVEVTEIFKEYKIISYGKTVGTHDLELPSLKFKTKGLWFAIPSSIKETVLELFSGGEAFEGGLHGAEHALISMLPLHVMCDRNDIGGISTSYDINTREATIFLYDVHEGGIGLSEKAMDLFEHILTVTLQMVKSCSCVEGCPSCIYSPKCANDNQPLNKKGTIIILKKLLKMIEKDRSDIDSKILNEKKLHSKPPRVRVGVELYKKSDEIGALNEAGIIQFNEGNIDDALTYFESSIKQKNSLIALKYKAMILEIQEKRSEALKYYDEALKLDSDNIKLLYYKSVTLFNDNQFLLANDILKKIIRKEPNCEEAWYLQGLISENNNDISKAVKHYCKALSINPEHQEALEKLDKLI